jgi:hypothetical protein
VDGARHHLLAGARLAEDQHRDVRTRHALDALHHRAEPGGGADDGLREVLAAEARQERAPVGLGRLPQRRHLAQALVVLERDREGLEQRAGHLHVVRVEAARRPRHQRQHAGRALLAGERARNHVALDLLREQRGQAVAQAAGAAVQDAPLPAPGRHALEVLLRGLAALQLGQGARAAGSARHGLEARAREVQAAHQHVVDGEPAPEERGQPLRRLADLDVPARLPPGVQQQGSEPLHAPSQHPSHLTGSIINDGNA